MVRNEEANLGTLLRSLASHVAEICILDTGSTDRTLEVIDEVIAECEQKSGTGSFRIEQYLGCNDPHSGLMLDFSDGRNRAFFMATQPWIMWLDGDDELCGTEHLCELLQRANAQRMLQKGANMPVQIRMPYETEIDGRVVTSYVRERIISRDEGAFAWVAPVHEVIVKKKQCLTLDTRDLDFSVRVVHRKVESGKKEFDFGRNLRILEHHLKKDGRLEPRMLFYYARDLMVAGRMDEAINRFEELVAPKTGAHPNEMTFALLKLVDVCNQRKEFGRAMLFARKLVKLAPELQESHFALGRVFYALGNEPQVQDPKHEATAQERKWFEEATGHFERGLATSPAQKPLFFQPMERDFRVYLYYVKALSEIGRQREAYGHVLRLLDEYPYEPTLIFNRKYLEETYGFGRETIGPEHKHEGARL